MPILKINMEENSSTDLLNETLIKARKKGGFLRSIYEWTVDWANTPYGVWALFILAFCEASFFPIPPDVLLLVLAVSNPKKSLKYALICSVGSVLGGCFGYYIGFQFFEYIGRRVLDFYGLMGQFERINGIFQEHSFLAIIVAAITPIPYKLFTIASGFCKVDFLTIVLASIVGRSSRFFAEALLIFLFGKGIKRF